MIDKDGNVSSANDNGSTIGNKNVVDCVLKRVKTWTFPQPEGGGSVTVNYPFVMQPS